MQYASSPPVGQLIQGTCNQFKAGELQKDNFEMKPCYNPGGRGFHAGLIGIVETSSGWSVKGAVLLNCSWSAQILCWRPVLATSTPNVGSVSHL